ncbi:hypothetical protein AVEN_198460-1 [Araneus ventricosus]|uniref:Uncharacterized protein n=1 Tax=Araneus ventricosus TaxID=182803 RepID=A0A4Y2ERY0_ARAVE|nr:hypothetical protein AVEN_198460-1 [Araneus ventricosus]
MLERDILLSKKLFKDFLKMIQMMMNKVTSILLLFPPESAEASDEEEGNDTILNHDIDELPCDTAGEVEVHKKRSLSPLKVVAVVQKYLKNQS